MADLVVELAKSVVEGALSKAEGALSTLSMAEVEGALSTLSKAEGALSKALRTLEKEKPRESLQDELVVITGEFELLRSFLKDANLDPVENSVVRAWERQLHELSYDVDECIELVVHRETKLSFWLSVHQFCRASVRWPELPPMDQALGDIEQLRARAVDLSKRARYRLISETGSASVARKQLSAHSDSGTMAAANMLAEARDAAKRMALGRDLTQLITRKVGDDHNLQVISVWGSGGDHGTASIIMKTYTDPEICRNFTYRSWVKLMHPFSPHDFIRIMMAQFHAAIGMDALMMVMQATKEDLCKVFQKLVTEARYLLVLEELSNMSDWHALMAFLPNSTKGSWIIVSTQQTEIASLCIGHSYQILELEQFSAEHSVCALFKKGSTIDGDKGKKPLVEDSFLDGLESPMNTGLEPHHLSLHYLKEITNNFCDEQIIGRGGFGVVYKGVLRNGKTIAVKKILQSVSHEQFEKEVEILMKLKHPNIVRLVGYCYETQHLHMPHEGKMIFAGSTEALLCLECLTNGSLDKYISDASSGLDWHTRYKIIEGISYGLHHLHEQPAGPVIHLDLKPANILLDDNMQPKITDFGLSRLFDKDQTIHTATTTGTRGYMSLEYILRGIITPMSDIFSLGVIIMEVITGHKGYPDDISTSSHDYFIETELQKWINRLQEEPGYASLEQDSQQIRRCIQIGLLCVNPERTRRPTMKLIIDMLQEKESINWCISNDVISPAINL